MTVCGRGRKVGGGFTKCFGAQKSQANDTTDEIPRKMNGILLKVKEEPSRQND